MYTAKITEIKKDVYQFSQEPFLNVEVSILDDKGKEVGTRKYAYKADMTEDEIVADLENMLKTFTLEVAQAEEQKDAIELNTKLDKTVDALKNAEIEMPE